MDYLRISVRIQTMHLESYFGRALRFIEEAMVVMYLSIILWQ